MTTSFSGFISMRRNLSRADPARLCTSIFVPANHTVMVRFKQVTQGQLPLTLYCTSCQKLTDSPQLKYRVWKRYIHDKSDFAHLLNTAQVSVEIETVSCIDTRCFTLLFSFFPESRRPVKLASGVWNCSVRHYASFHPLLACNLKTECEDGRDETGPCPYSSPGCRGMIALCNRCYKLVETLRGFTSDKKDFNERTNDYCISVGGQLSLPKCVYDWRDTIERRTKIHSKRLSKLWTGLYSYDRSLPSMYVYVVVHDDKTVLHHSFDYHFGLKSPSKRCIHTTAKSFSYGRSCTIRGRFILDYGAFCEYNDTNAEESVNKSVSLSLVNSDFVLPSGQHHWAKCPYGHVTHAFLLCGSDPYKICGQEYKSLCTFSGHLLHSEGLDSPEHRTSVIPTYPCSDGSTEFSYTVVCDFISDCPDHSDESFCKHPPCVRQFRCTYGQCLPFDKVCDYTFHCHDHSDEKGCPVFRSLSRRRQPLVPFPVLVNFDGVRYFTYTPMNSSESCPDSHYRCPGDFNDCLPVYTRCNGMHDCLDHQDEDDCEDITCPGCFRCRRSKLCLHSDDICDGWSHCPMNDDELSCNVTCPAKCLCQGHTFLCIQRFAASLFPQLRFLNATGSGMTLSDLKNNSLLVGVVLARCCIESLSKVQLLNVKYLDLCLNKLQHVNLTSFLGLDNLQSLSLSRNPLTSLHAGLSSTYQLRALAVLDLSHTTLTVLDTTVLSLFPHLQKLNLTFTFIHTISPAGFQPVPLLTELYMDGSPVKMFSSDIFKGLLHLSFVSTGNYKFCCAEILPYNFDSSACVAPKDEISSCEDLLQSWTYRGFLWLIACLSLTGNVFCCCARLFAKTLASSSGYSVFVTNLAMADFLMGVYITIIGVADEQFRGRYLHSDDMWKHSVTCKIAGCLSLLSSEVSALIIWFITLDRFIVLRFPFSTVRFGRTSAAMACVLTWLTGWILATLPLLPVTSHWAFYSQTGICIPLSVTRREFRGRVYSFSVLIFFNFIVFLFISGGQALIYQSIQDNALKSDSSKVSRDITVARRLITIAVTDFLCWFPIGLCGVLALAGVPIPGEVNVALAIFVLPLNSAINPFMYTLNTLTEKRRRANEAKLFMWLKTHHDSIPN